MGYNKKLRAGRGKAPFSASASYFQLPKKVPDPLPPQIPSGKKGKIMRTLGGFLVLLLFVTAFGWSLGQGPKKPPVGKDDTKVKDTGKKGPGDGTGKPATFDKLKLSPNTIVILADAINAIPKMIMMSPERYQAMLDEIASLKSKLKVEKKLPHSCKLTAQVEGNRVAMQAEFAFTTENPNMTVALGLQGANLKDEGELWRGQGERQTPLLDVGPDGYVVQVEKPGSYKLTLNLKLPVGMKRTGTGSGAERAFELGLPGAAVTTLSLEPPPGVKEIRWNDHPESRQEAARLTLGKIKSLNVSWKEPVSIPGTAALLTADALITVKLEENQVVTMAELKLGDLRGQPHEEWRLLLPPQAKVEVKSPAGLQADILPQGKDGTTVIRLKEASAETIQVLVQVQQPRPAPPARQAIGPFLLLGAFEQQGRIHIKASPDARRGLRWLFHPRSEVFPRDLPANSPPDLLAMFSYDKLVNFGKNGPKSARPWAPLELESKVEKGQIETHVEHFLRLSQIPDGWQADLTTKIKGQLQSANVDVLEVQLPRPRADGLALLAACQGFPGLPWGAFYFATKRNWPITVPGEFQCHGQAGFTPELRLAGPGRARIHLNRPDNKDFTVVLTGKYLLYSDARKARIELPRPLGTLDRGGQVKIVVDGNLELLTDLPGVEQAPGKQSQTVPFDQAPSQIEFAWRSFRPEYSVSGVTDITIHHNNAHFRHQLQLPGAGRGQPPFSAPEDNSLMPKKVPDPLPPRKTKGQTPVLFRIPPAIKGLKIEPPEGLQIYNPEKGIAWILPTDQGRPSSVVIEYDLALPGGQGVGKFRSFSVPLLWPEKATHIDAKVRVWCDSGMIPTLAHAELAMDHWRDRGTEPVSDHANLPGLVLYGVGRTLPLTLRLQEGETNLPTVVFDRGLVQVSVREDGAQYYRARFVVRKVNADHLDIQFPGPVADSRQENSETGTSTKILLLGISLDKKGIDPQRDGNRLRVPVNPGLYAEGVLLDLEYLVPPAAAEGERNWQSVFHPPLFANAVFVAGIRWQAALPAGVVAIGELGGHLEYHWDFRNWLLTPEPTVTKDERERWLTGSDRTRPISLVLDKASLDPVRIRHFPRQIWFLLSSGLVLAVGLVLGLSSSRFIFWLLVVMVIAVGVATSLVWPALIPVFVYGCQPGLVVLLVILAIQWMLQERYRRQVVFMPGFTRLKSNSSLIRSGAGRSREPTTVDSPAASQSVGTGPTKGT
jgi:hypothetical protein